MIYMDIDLHSPSFRNIRHCSIKRPRSPEPASPVDRPSKRPSLFTDHSTSYPSLRVRRRLGDNSAGSSRHSSEDWVQQAGGLTIDSPIYALSELRDPEAVSREEDMMVETADYTLQQDNSTQTDRPRLPPLHTSGYAPFSTGNSTAVDVGHGFSQPPIPSITVDVVDYTPFQILPPLPEHQHQQLLLGPGSITGPSINVEPPTPMSPMEHQSTQEYSNRSSSMSPRTDSLLMTVSPAQELPTPRKQRFTMGPRADCEKCRLGVKGHFVHLD